LSPGVACRAGALLIDRVAVRVAVFLVGVTYRIFWTVQTGG
jgi:hypothetical protein